MRDDKSFPNILISSEHPFPQIKSLPGAKKEKGAYFGPFASAGAVNRTLNQLQKVFLLRNCTNAMFESRTRPCLRYQIKRCAAYVGRISQTGYGELVSDAKLFLEGKSTNVQADLAKQMAEASDGMEFERAAALRDRIRALTAVQSSQGINPRGVAEADVVALHLDHGQACVQVFFIRAHQSWGNRDFYPAPRRGPGTEILEAFLTQFYDDKEPPRLILLSHPVENPDLVEQALSDRAGRKVELAVPQRGEKASWSRMPSAMPAKAWRGACRKAAPRTSCCKVWPMPSTLMARPSGSRFTTTPISRAATPWAA